MAIVGDYTGTLTAIGLTEKITPWTGRINSRSEARPALSPDRKILAVASNSGRVYVYSGSTNPSVQFRFETTSSISGSLAAGKDGFYIGTGEGVLAKVGFDGKQKWTFHLSHPISQPAFYDTETGLVFLASESGEFTAVDDVTGQEAWNNSVLSNIFAPLGSAGSNIICRSSDDCIVSYDKKTGQLRGRTNSVRLLPTPIVNTLTDRVYLASNTGQIQCLRPIGKDLPKISKAIAAPFAKPKQEKPTEQEPMNAAPVGADPFGGTGDMPAGGDAGGADPFASDPFGGTGGSGNP
ncbi:MAG: PQQ-binding-like beta-propeller repeat protein [Pirellulales bacterium]